MAAAGGRSAEILERLAREQPRRSLFRRPPSPFDADLGNEPDAPIDGLGAPNPGRTESWSPGRLVSWPPGRVLGVLAAVACAAGVAALLLFDRRPPAIEERLPLASEESPASTSPGAGPANHGSPNDGAAPTEWAADAAAEDGGAVFVHVAGAVSSPGVVELPSGSRVVDAVRAAGGLRPDADPDRVNLAAELVDGQRIVIPALGQEVPAEVVPTGSSPAGGGPSSSGGGTGGASGPVDLNTATAEQLDSLPGVGPATAAAILSHREQHGPFRSVEDLIEVRGIGEAKLDGLRDLVTVGGS